MVTPSTTNADSQYVMAVDRVAAILKGSDIHVISTVSSERNTEGKFSWPNKRSKSLLILYETAESAVARGLLGGELPSRVLARWISDAEVLLSKHRERRRQLTFVSVSAVLTEPDNFLTVLSRRFEGLDFPHDQLNPEKPAWFDWQGLLARQIVSDEPTAARLSSELEAAALPVAACYYDLDGAASELNALLSDRKQLSALLEKVQTQAISDLAEKEEAAAERLGVAQAEAEARQSDLETERGLLRDQIMHLRQAVQEHVDVVTEQRHELSAMKLTLTAAQDRVDGLEATLQGLATQVARDKVDIDTLTNEKQKILEDVDVLVEKKQIMIDIFNQLMVRILHGKELVRWPWESRRMQQISIVRDCNVVDPDWYLQYHQDVFKVGAEPFRHYIDYGAKEGRPPNASFV